MQEELQKEFDNYSKKSSELFKFREENYEILKKNFDLEDEERVAKFTLTEKIDMWIEEGKIKEPIYLDNGAVELSIRPKENKVTIFPKNLYNPNFNQNVNPNQGEN